MVSLFKTNILISGKNIPYDVSFHDEQYHFKPLINEGKTFYFRREEDEWHTGDALDETTKIAATDALENYLLSQH